jgi:hypothetical protein
MDEHIDYIENAHNFDSQSLTSEDVEQLGNVLLNTASPLDEKKKALGILAHRADLQAYNYLKQYAVQPDAGLEEWAKLALGECTLFLHADLSDGDSEEEFVFTGVGKNNNQLRYYFMVLPVTEDKIFEIGQHTIIENEMSYVARDLNCEIEWLDCKPNYVGFSVLMPVTVSIATYIKKGITQCNELGGFLLEEYYCGSGVPDEKEIEKIIQIVRNGEEN